MSIPAPTGFKTDNTEASAQERGLFDCFGKKEEKEDVLVTEAEHKPSLMDKLHRSKSSSSSSSDEEVEEDGVKIRRRKKKGVTEKIKEKLPGHENESAPEGSHLEEKKGFLEKIKEKIPGYHKGEEEVISPHPAPAPTAGHVPAPTPTVGHVPAPTPPHCQTGVHCGEVHEAQEPLEKKGIIAKIKEKFPGGNKDGDDVKKDY